MAGHSLSELEEIMSGLDRLDVSDKSQDSVESQPNSAEAGPSNQFGLGGNIAQNVQHPQPAQVAARDLSYLKNSHEIKDVYDYASDHRIGIGSFGQVHEMREKSTGIHYAMKSIDLQRWTVDRTAEAKAREHREAKIMDEIDVLSSLDHENVLRMKEYFKENDKIHIITDLLSGGDIIHAVLRRNPYTEADAQLLFSKLFSTIKYLHDNNVVHRDLKPENILLQNPHDFASIKIIDFGAAKKNEPPSTPVGTAEYVSPEVILRYMGYETGSYTGATDLWSAGVVMFSLLDGSHPFGGDDINDKGTIGCSKQKRLRENTLHRELSFDDRSWNKLSKSAKDLVSKLLNRDPRTRITAAEALAHPWFTEQPKRLPMDNTKEKLITFKAIPIPGRWKVWRRWSGFTQYSFY